MMTTDEAIEILRKMLIVNQRERMAVDMACAALRGLDSVVDLLGRYGFWDDDDTET